MYSFGDAEVEPTVSATAFWHYPEKRLVLEVGYYSPLALMASVVGVG